MKLFNCVFVLFVLLCFKLESAHLHTILVGDTIGGEIEFMGSLDNMQREAKRIAALTDLELNGLVFEGQQVRIDNILEEISKLPIESDDVVLLYFAAHGSRTYAKANKWPDLHFAIDLGINGSYLDFQKVNELVLAKNPRLIISLADSCNSYRSENSEEDDEEYSQDVMEAIPLPSPSHNKITLSKAEIELYKGFTEDDEIARYYELFRTSRGSVIASASSPGEIGIKFPIIGGIFSIKFLECLHNATCSGSDGWESILRLVSERTKAELAIHGIFETTPQYAIE